MKKHKKGQMLALFFAVFVILFCGIIIAASQLFSTKQSVETLKFSEEASAVNTHLYVLLNSNDCTPQTRLPLKTVLGTALARNPIPSPDEEITIDYNSEQDKLTIIECVQDFTKRLQIEEYNFSVEYNGEEKMKISALAPKTEDISAEQEYIAVPEDSIAKVVLKIKIEPEIEAGKNTCPGDENYRCVPEKTCSLFGGICKSNYACIPTQCCCKDLPL